MRNKKDLCYKIKIELQKKYPEINLIENIKFIDGELFIENQFRLFFDIEGLFYKRFKIFKINNLSYKISKKDKNIKYERGIGTNILNDLKIILKELNFKTIYAEHVINKKFFENHKFKKQYEIFNSGKHLYKLKL